MQSNLNSLRKKVCVFDFDGTLVNSMTGFAEIAGKIMEAHYSLTYQQAHSAYLKTSGLPFIQQLESLFPKNPINPTAANRFEIKKRQDYLNKLFFQEVPQVIPYLQEQGIRTVISSNNGQEVVEEYLTKWPAPRFDLVLGFRDGFSKGEPHFRRVFDHFQVTPQEILFVGDSLHDAQIALRSNIEFVGREGTFLADDFKKISPQLQTIKDLNDLKGILCR